MSPVSISPENTAFIAASCPSKGLAVPSKTNIEVSRAEIFITEPSGARFPFRMAMAPVSVRGLFIGLMTFSVFSL